MPKQQYSKKEIAEKVRGLISIFARFGDLDEQQRKSNSLRLKEDLLISSREKSTIILSLSSYYSIPISGHEAEATLTIQDCIDLACTKLGLQ